MIFGFNTEVAREGTVYHVQSELRSREALLQTQVFVSGQCIGKISAPIPAGTAEPDAQDLLREQHRHAVAAAREGGIQALLEDHDGPFQLAWEGDGPTFAQGKVSMKFIVSDSAGPLQSAAVSVEIQAGEGSISQIATAATDAAGLARLALPMEEDALEESFVTVEAAHQEGRVVHRYRLQRRSEPVPPPTKCTTSS
jgi:hypothetical protein